MYDDILLATDGETASRDATEQALELAGHHGATLHTLFVVDSDVYSAYSGDEYVDEREGPEHGLEELGSEVLDEVGERARSAGVAVTGALEHGRPHEVIVDYADDHDVDLLVLGTKRHTDEYRRLLGSVTDRVVRLSSRPVLVVKTPVDGE